MHMVKTISMRMAAPLIMQEHYTHSLGQFVVAYGLFDNDNLINEYNNQKTLLPVPRLCGVITYGMSVNPYLAASIFEGGNNDNVLEFLRMAVIKTCEIKRSWFISKTIKALKKDYSQIKAFVSFADTSQGHNGAVYQASNWLYAGMCSENYHYESINNDRIHKRTIWLRAQRLGLTEKQMQQKLNLNKIIEKPKHRYVYLLDKSVKCKYKNLNYPKHDGGVKSSTASSQLVSVGSNPTCRIEAN